MILFRIKQKLSSVCKIITTSGKIGCGFLMKLYKGENPFFCLISNNNIINYSMVKSKEIVELNYDNLNKSIKIQLDKKERFIVDFSFINIEAIIIEMLPKDNINENYFLSPNLICRDDSKLLDKDIYTIKLNINKIDIIVNRINSINQYEFIYSKKLSGMPGSPIFFEGAERILGINKEEQKNENKYSGNTIIPIIDSIKLNLEYGIIKIGKDFYQGFMKNTIFEGYGKYVYENGNYYIGQFLNGLKHGKGIEYYKNNSIKYDGYYSKDKCDKYGIYIYENGNYYIGQFSKGLKHGHGIEYYKNNRIKYGGDFVNGKCEGYGKYIYENGNYYLGNFKNGFKHGKGTLFYKNNTIKYEGEFVNDKCEGNGKFIYEDGEYYIGEFSNNQRNGKGTIYYKNNTIKYQGNFINDEFIE